MLFRSNTDRLKYWVEEIEPNEFIVPDVWEDYAASIRNARSWTNVMLPANTTKVAVVQAKSIYEAGLCVQAYRDLGYKKIAFSYGAEYYHEMCPHPNKDLGKAIGRYMVISQVSNQSLRVKKLCHRLNSRNLFKKRRWYLLMDVANKLCCC